MPSKKSSQSQPPSPKVSPREQRLAEALRANLRRRKAAARAGEPESPPAEESDAGE